MEINANTDIDPPYDDDVADTMDVDKVHRHPGVMVYISRFFKKMVTCCEPKRKLFEPLSAVKPYWDNICQTSEFFIVKEVNGFGESFDKIPQMEATCKMCFLLLQEKISVLKTKCICKFSLVHEKCYTENLAKKQNEDICDACGEIIRYVPVTVSRYGEPEDFVEEIESKPGNVQLPESSKRFNKWFSKFARS